MDMELLRSIGLTDSEIKVYLALLELGSSSKGPVVDKSGVASSKIYELLEKLQQKGLVSSVVKSGVKYFETASPTRLLDYMQEKERTLKEKKLELESLIPELELKRSLAGVGSETQVFKGMKGAATSFDDILRTLKKGDEYYVFGISEFSPHFERFVVNFHKKRAKMGIKCKVIVNELARDVGEKLEPLKFTRVKYIQKELFTPFVFIIYADRVLISIGLDEVFIQVKSEKLASGLKRYADYMWGQEVSIARGYESMKKALQSFMNSLEEGETWDVLGATFGKDTKKVAELFTEIHEQRRERGIEGRMLFEQGAMSVIENNKGNKKYKESVLHKGNIVKYLPYKTQSPVAIFPSKEKTLLVIQQKEPTVITINNKDVSKSFKNHFEQLWDQDTMVLKGIDSVQQMFEEMLQAGHCDFIGARGYFVDRRPKYVDDWEKRAIAKGFTMRNVVDPEVKGHRITKFSFTETKYSLKKEFSTLSAFWIFGEKVAISNWMENEEPIVLVINNKRLHKMYKQQFEMLWGLK